jgi:hypothetical protein
MSDDRVFLTPEQATAMLSDDDQIHTFRQSIGGVLLGADWDRDDLVKAIDVAENRELSGEQATKMHHGLCITDNHGPLFIETKD